jgi:predicted SAM-dependent methyltransferase
MYVSKNFDEPWAYIDENPEISTNSVVTWQLCEPGYVEVNRKNIEMNFGKTWDKFEESNFEEFNKFYTSDKPDVEVGLGWYMPVLFPKKMFIDEGMYPTDPPFPHPNDIIFFEKLQNYHFYKIGRLVYHFQRLSQRNSKPLLRNLDKLNLCCGADQRQDYINHDVEGRELNFDLSNGIIPLEDSTFSEVLFRHALEHFRFEVGEQIVKEIYRILKPNGFVTIHVPDLSLACEDLYIGVDKYTNCAYAIKRLYGLNTSEHQVHKSGYTIKMLGDLLEKCGYINIELLPTSIPDEICMKGVK